MFLIGYKDFSKSDNHDGGGNVDQLQTSSSKHGSSGFPSSELSFDPIPLPLIKSEETFTSTPTFVAEPVFSSAVGSSQSLDFQVGVENGSQSYSPNLVYEDVFHYPSAGDAELPSKEVGHSNYDSVTALQSSMWPSASSDSKDEEPVFSTNLVDWAPAASTANNAWTLAVSSGGTKGADFGSSQNLNFQLGVEGGSQSYSSHNLVYEDVFHYPDVYAWQPFKEVGPSNHDSHESSQKVRKLFPST